MLKVLKTISIETLFALLIAIAYGLFTIVLIAVITDVLGMKDASTLILNTFSPSWPGIMLVCLIYLIPSMLSVWLLKFVFSHSANIQKP